MNSGWPMGCLLVVLISIGADAAEEELPAAKPVPAVEVIPLPYDQASFQHAGRELTRYHHGPLLQRPFCYPMAGPEGRSLTRMGHPRDPFGHSHHNSVWISHADVGGVNFWADRGKDVGRIVHQRVEQFEDGQRSAWMLVLNHWQDATGKIILVERRRIEVEPLGPNQWLMYLDLEFQPPAGATVTIGASPFGMIGVRMAKTIGVADGGGRALNSEGLRNEEQAFRKPARWMDYSGPVTNGATGGITLMDHPANPNHPAPFHLRNDGWMGACLTLERPLSIEPGQRLRLRYGLWVHEGVPEGQQVQQRWQAFAKQPLPVLGRQKQ